MADSSQLPSTSELQQHMQDTSMKPSVSAAKMDPSSTAEPLTESTPIAKAPMGSEPLEDALAGMSSSYKSPAELLFAPSHGKVSIAGRRLFTGEIVQPEVIHLQDFAGKDSHGDTGSKLPPMSASPSTPQTPAAATEAAVDAPDTVPTGSSPFDNQPATATPVTATSSSSASRTIQETTKTSEQVYVTHATVAAAAAAAGGLVGGAHRLDVRTAANVAEAAVDPAAVVDFDCMSPTTAAAASAGQHSLGQAAGSLGEAGTAGEQGEVGSGGTAAAGQVSTGDASTAEGVAGHAVLPEDREDVAATLQRLRSAGQIQGPDAPTGASTGPSTEPAAVANAEDSFVGAAVTGAGAVTGSASAFSAAAAAGHPSAQGVSAGTAAPALAGYPDPTVGTAAEDTSTTSAATAPQAEPDSSSGLFAAHDAAAKAAAVAGALAHVGVAVNSAAALADTATQPAQAVEAAAAAAAATGTDAGHADTSTVRASSLHQQHTLAEFLLDDHAVQLAATQHSADSSANATAASSLYQVDLSAGTSLVAADDDLQVQLDVGRSRRVLSPDGTVAAPAATVPEEAVAAIKASEAAEAPKSPRHPSLRQLSMSRQPDNAGSSSSQQDKTSSSGLPYGLTVADIVAATVASEERRFRVVSPRSSAGDNFFTASSSSAPSTPRADAAAAVERSNSPLSASATKAIYDSVQLAVQQQQEQEQLALAVAHSASLGLARGLADQYRGDDAADFAVGGAGDSAEASTTAQMHSAGSQDSTATSSRPSSAGSAGRAGEVPCSVDNQGPAATAVAKQNAEVMQEVMKDTAGAAHGTVAPIAAAGSPVLRADTLSTDSTASQCGDDSEYKAAAVVPCSDDAAGSGPNSSSTSAGDRLAAAVAAEAADPIAAAAAGVDVAATAAPAFPSVVFGVGAMPIDLPATSRGTGSVESGPSSAGKDTAGVFEDLSTAAALASTGLAALDEDSSMQESVLPAQEDPAVQEVVDATSAAVVSSAGLGATAVAAATAAAAATELHAETPDPAVAAASAAQLVVDAATTVPGMLDPADVASAAAAAGAAAAAAATPGMDPTSAAVACAVAASHPLADPEDVAAAAARAVASMQDSAGADEPISLVSVSAGIEGVPAASEVVSGAPGSVGGSVGVGGDLTGLLPIMAPAGQIGDAIPVSSGSSTGTGSTAPAQLSTVPEASESEVSSAADVAGVQMGAQQGGMFEGTSEAGGSVEVLNREGLAKMFDPLIVQLAMATSTPLEGLGVDESALAGMDSAAAIAAAGRAFTNSSSFGAARSGGSGMLLLQPHPLAGAASLGTSTGLGGGPPEGGVLQTHLAAAEEALAQLDSGNKLQRRQTDSISLGAGRSALLGELDEAALAAVGGTAEAPAGPAEGMRDG